LSYLKKDAIICVISFHSLEDRIVKNWMNDAESAGQIEIITSGVIEAGTTEVAKNPRSRSAKLRVAKRIL
jgi:16S rRNA (cytosine1402-N4)-methyltransferase